MGRTVEKECVLMILGRGLCIGVFLPPAEKHSKRGSKILQISNSQKEASNRGPRVKRDQGSRHSKIQGENLLENA